MHMSSGAVALALRTCRNPAKIMGI